MIRADIIIIGAGILGAATAHELIKKYPKKKIILLEKEGEAATHQTGRNSGVIHAGVYYPAESLKAKYCKEGLKQTIAFCQAHSLPFEQCGKVLVATGELELQRMHDLFKRCEENELSPVLLSQKQLRQREPNINGLGAILVGETGITNYRAITLKLISLFKDAGGKVAYEQQVVSIEDCNNGITINTEGDAFFCHTLINCAGLQADRIVKMLNIDIDYQIIPFKGEYFRLPSRYNDIVNHLIYPIPNPDLPFLGVHLTKMIDGTVTVGPNAVLSFAREGYKKWQFNLRDNIELLKFEGTKKLFRQYFNSGVSEFKNSMYKRGYLAQVQKYCPKITIDDLQPYPSGIRAQAVNTEGELIHDFKFFETEHSLHVGNAPSPAATSAMPIAKSIVERVSSDWV